jgi:hypothetical protein
MERVADLLDAKHVDVGRQLVVDSPPQCLGRHRRSNVEMRHLRERMHAGIGASRSVQLELVLIGGGLDRALDLSLHRLRVLLELPPAVPGAGIFDGQLESHLT